MSPPLEPERKTLRNRLGGAVAAIAVLLAKFKGVLLLLPNGPTWVIVTALMINGYAGGTKLQLVGFLTAAYSGMRQFGTIFGIMASLIAGGSGLGPVLGGWIYDTWHSYTPALWGGFLLTLFSACLLLGLGAYPDWSREGETAAA